ncbi:MAG: M20 family metallo-hydrolase [Thermaerobacter sp.]|nr:M20 family metallo-hydrolase [Thermaerobacter sp.]
MKTLGPETIEQRLLALARLTQPGSLGVTRLLYTPAWHDAQALVYRWMEDAGLCPWWDAVGNVHGRVDGASETTILTGSHIDTVVNGGAYDGAYGVVGAIWALSHLKQRPFLRQSVEVVSFCEEEGSHFPITCWGSRALMGEVTPGDAKTICDPDGVSLRQAMDAHHLNADKISEAAKDYAAFVELHIEQGPWLEAQGKDIGVVTSIFGQERWTVRVKGVSRHAGTTALRDRHDALIAASRMVLAVQDVANSSEHIGIATVGELHVIGGSTNCVPGDVVFHVDLRAETDRVRQRLAGQLTHHFQQIAQSTGVTVAIEKNTDERMVKMDATLQNVIAGSCRSQGLSFMPIASRAGHDAQIIGRKIPTAMIFVPSHQGLSHHGEEYTAPEQLQRGVAVLLQTLEQLAQGLPGVGQDQSFATPNVLPGRWFG